MTDEVFAWTTASNNDAFLAGRLSLAVNAISIRRTAEDRRLALADDTWLAPIPRGPVRRLQRARHGHLLHLEVRQEQGSGEAIPRRPAAWLVSVPRRASTTTSPGRTRSRAASSRSARSARRTAQASSQYRILTSIAENNTTNVGYPGYGTPLSGRSSPQGLIPQMFAQVAQGKMTPQEAAAKAADRQFKTIFKKWRDQGLIP